MHYFADFRLGQLLEGLAASEMRRFADTAARLDTALGADWIEVAGGVAAYVGSDSPVNRAMGLGMAGEPVADDEVSRLEDFFQDRGAEPSAGICPLAHPTLIDAMVRRGWIISGFENVLFRDLQVSPATSQPSPAVEVREVQGEEERDVWALVASTGFSDPLPPLPQQLALARVVVRRPGSRLFLALVDGKAAGTGEMFIEEGVAWLSADTTLPQFRGRGVQQSLQRARLEEGALAGCYLAATESTPGSASQRNMERVGFQVAYTRADMVHPVKQ